MDTILKTISDGIKLAGISMVLFVLALIYGLFMFSELALSIFIDGVSFKNLIVLVAVGTSFALSGLLGILVRNSVDQFKKFANSAKDSYTSSRGSSRGLANQGG